MLGIFDRAVAVSHVSGDLTKFGFKLVDNPMSHDLSLAWMYLGLLLSFICGSFVCGTIIGRGPDLNFGLSMYGVVLVAVSFVLLAAWSVAEHPSGRGELCASFLNFIIMLYIYVACA